MVCSTWLSCLFVKFRPYIQSVQGVKMSLGNDKVCYADAAVANVIAGFCTRSSSSYIHTIKRQEVLNRDPLKASVKVLAYT